jgi:hypothetical protein
MTKPARTRALGSTVLVAAIVFLLAAAVAAAAAPTARTDAASSVSTTSARLNGTVNPNGESTSWYFEFGTSTSYGTKTASRNAGSGTKSVSVTMSISGLSASTTYHYRLVAQNRSGTTLGNDQAFTTNSAPAVQTGAAQGLGTTTATLTGSVDPRGRSTNWHFDYGTTTSYGSKTQSQNAGSGNGAKSVTAALSGLTPGTTYHYRLVATNAVGSTLGADLTFATLPAVTLVQSALRVIAGGYVTLSGTVSGASTGVQVTVLAQPFGAGSFTTVATVITGGGGAWTYLARPTIGTSYQASANGGTSSSVAIGVQPAVSLQLITGARFSTRVTAKSSFAGKLVQFQRLSSGRWVTLKQTRLNSRSAAIFPATLLPKGRSTIRVAMSVNQAGPGYLGGFSRMLTYTRR